MPNALGADILAKVGETYAAGREPLESTKVGAATGFGLAVLLGTFQYSDVGTFALVLVSAACAGICRAWIQWDR